MTAESRPAPSASASTWGFGTHMAHTQGHAAKSAGRGNAGEVGAATAGVSVCMQDKGGMGGRMCMLKLVEMSVFN
jgi:hypothetical protein